MSSQLALGLPEVPVPPRSECVAGPRPCPHYGCRYHLWVVRERAGRRQGRGSLRWWSTPQPVVRQHSPETCALDVVDREPDGAGRVTVGRLLGMTKERVRQIEERALAKLQAYRDDL